MSSFSAITVTIDPDIQEAVINDLKTAPRKFRRLYRARIVAIQDRTLRRLQTPAPPVKYPIQWKTAKQRRAYFATKGFGKGIPTRRTGALQKGWKAIIEGDIREGLFTVYNDAVTRDYFTGAIVYYEQFVTGVNQQPFHRATGYTPSQDILLDAMVEAEEIMVSTWWEVNNAR